MKRKNDIINWAKEKGILEKSNPTKQHEKTQEEVDELKKAIEENDREEIIDGIGDAIVTLVIQAELNGLDVEECIESAYNVIKNRTGKMVDGIFVKDK